MRFKTLFIAVISCCPIISNAQTIKKFVDNTTLINPSGMAIDISGNIYIADKNKSVVIKVTPSGIVTNIAGTGVAGFSGDGGPATNATFRGPMGVAIDASGNIYVADMVNERVRKIDPTGIITTIAGSSTMPDWGGYSGDGGPATAAELRNPCAVLVDKAGNIYIGDAGNDRIRKINSSGIISTYNSKINGPISLVFDASENMYVAGYYSNKVYKINPSGKTVIIAGNGYSGGSSFTQGGYNGDGMQATDAWLNAPCGVAVDDNGNVYITDESNYRVRKINKSGIISTICGAGAKANTGDGGPAPLANIAWPFGIAVNKSGTTIYVGDHLSGVVRVIDDLDRFPYFTHGKSQTVNFCLESTVINPFLAINDLDTGKALTWTLISRPNHGYVATSYAQASTGSTITPSGFVYIRGRGYAGNDTIVMAVTDGIKSDTSSLYISCDTTLEIKNQTITNSQINIFPNPSNGNFNVTVNDATNESVTIIVTNLFGQKIKELTSVANQPTEITLNMPSGIYVVSVITKEWKSDQRIIITR
ncbi:MAG: hypothetical protein JWQ38_1304 [Flavipsychrobacter sp.]|nr:hypothetical protein [Flavipsychrobacter sp.]